jgi:hypothetical protein
VNKRIKEAIPGIIIQLNKNKIADASALLGFDACIDNIVRVVKEKKEDSDTGFFTSSHQFGEFLVNLDNKSCGVELHTKLSKLGGNMVITGNALGNLGIKVECLGTFGLPDILPLFRTMSAKCSLHTVGETITATALEFSDSKVIMFDPGSYNKITWNGIKELLGIERIKQLFSAKQLIAFLNWSEIENSSVIWKGVLDEILSSIAQTEVRPFFFTDFSDCSRRSKKEIQYAIFLLGRFRYYFKVILSLNHNEAELIAMAMDISHSSSEKEFIKSLFNATNTDILTIHRTKEAIAYDGITFEKCDTFFCKEPAILTGGGDNYNAGFCFALFHDFDLFQSLLVANAVSGSYVKTGISPDIENLTFFLKHKLGPGII